MRFGFSSREEKYLIAGLGNPGLQYENTRHNAGFAAIDAFAKKYGCSFDKHKFNSVYTKTECCGKEVYLLKPQTYMNLSGKAVCEITSFYKIPSDRIIVMFDDISLPVGNIRIRRKGSAGGHNGIKDIIELMGTEEIMRIKIGVGERANRDFDLKDWVLGKIPDEQRADFNNALDKAVLSAEEIIKNGIDSAMNKYSR